MKLKMLAMIMIVAAVWAVPASADIDPLNPDWVIFRDPFGEFDPDAEAPLHGYESFYDQYMEVAQGESFTLHVVVNSFPPAGWTQIGAYQHMFWTNEMVVQNWPTPNYTWTNVADMFNPAEAQIQTWNSYVQLTNQNYMGSAQDYLAWPAESPFVIVSWDFTILPNAPLVTLTIPMRFKAFGGWPLAEIVANKVWNDSAFTMKILKTWMPGDVDHDDDVDADDIDELCRYIRTSGADPLPGVNYDLSDDGVNASGGGGVVDMNDLDYLVRVLVYTDVGEGTEYGDFNLDGMVDTTDLTRMATNYGADDWTWDDGNANGYIDTDIDNTDLTILATYYGFGEPDVVPEPATLSLLALGAAALIRRRK